jgi:ribosomal protein L37AE/L43A
MKDSIAASRSQYLICPICERGELLEPAGSGVAGCEVCGCTLSGKILAEIREIISLPDALGSHACECGHPEMRRLPDEVFWCPACGSEVLPAEEKREPEVPPRAA